MDITKYKFFQKLTQLSFIDEIWLYGSRARGDQKERSDIDLAIIGSKITPEEWQEVREVLSEPDTLLKIDCVRFDTLKDEAFKKNILRDKKILFKREITMQEAINEKIIKLENAIKSLEEATKATVDPSRFIIDSVVKRFEFTFEFFWKTLKIILESRGIQVEFPRDVLQVAYQGNLISDEKTFLDMLDDRNETSHTYDQSIADEIYNNIKFKHTPLLKKETNNIKNLFYKI